jgi:hypothetical protein
MSKLPIPKHLKNILVPIRKNNENSFSGFLKCKCGNDLDFKILYPGETKVYKNDIITVVKEYNNNFYFIIKVICLKCNENYLLFDNNLHGWDGFVCHDYNKPIYPDSELQLWKCTNCNSYNHNLIISINSQGKQDFIDEAGSDFNVDDWVEAFDWITISIKCNNCKKEIKEWVSYETM